MTIPAPTLNQPALATLTPRRYRETAAGFGKAGRLYKSTSTWMQLEWFHGPRMRFAEVGDDVGVDDVGL